MIDYVMPEPHLGSEACVELITADNKMHCCYRGLNHEQRDANPFIHMCACGFRWYNTAAQEEQNLKGALGIDQ